MEDRAILYCNIKQIKYIREIRFYDIIIVNQCVNNIELQEI